MDPGRRDKLGPGMTTERLVVEFRTGVFAEYAAAPPTPPTGGTRGLPCARASRDRPRSRPGSRALPGGRASASVRPLASTWMRSETFITSRMSCSTRTTVMPSRISRRMMASISAVSTGLQPAAGSSSSSSFRLARQRAGDFKALEAAVGQARRRRSAGRRARRDRAPPWPPRGSPGFAAPPPADAAGPRMMPVGSCGGGRP